MQIHQGIHNLPPTKKQQAYSTSSMNSSPKKSSAASDETAALQQKIAALEKQLQWEKLRADALDTMIYHILNGDALAYSFADAKMEGKIIVVREALVDGDVSGNDLQTFWHSRAKHIGVTATEYQEKVASEFEKIINAPGDSEFNLWFEYDLFCQVNSWFVISLINNLPAKKKVYAVYTSYLDKKDQHFWNGFGPANAGQLQTCFADRMLLSDADLHLGKELWSAYKSNNFEALNHLAKSQSTTFPYLQDVVQAHIDRFPTDGSKGRPEKVIEEIITTVSANFPAVCKEFWKRESIYGFGDTQVKQLYDKVIQDRKNQ